MRYLLFLSTLFSHFSLATDRFDFANELIKSGDYYRGLTVLKEIEWQNRGKKRGQRAQSEIIKLHLRSGEFEDFDLEVIKYTSFYRKEFQDSQIIEAEVSFFLKNYDQAFSQILNTEDSPEKKYLFGGYSDLKIELPNCESPNCSKIKSIKSEIDNEENYKSESLALVLGIIPGMGQVYAGKTSSGIATFVLNSIFIAFSVSAFNNNEEVLGWGTALVGGTFYLTSIYSGVVSVKNYNLAVKRDIRRKLSDVPVQFQIIKMTF